MMKRPDSRTLSIGVVQGLVDSLNEKGFCLSVNETYPVSEQLNQVMAFASRNGVYIPGHDNYDHQIVEQHKEVVILALREYVSRIQNGCDPNTVEMRGYSRIARNIGIGTKERDGLSTCYFYYSDEPEMTVSFEIDPADYGKIVEELRSNLEVYNTPADIIKEHGNQVLMSIITGNGIGQGSPFNFQETERRNEAIEKLEQAVAMYGELLALPDKTAIEVETERAIGFIQLPFELGATLKMIKLMNECEDINDIFEVQVEEIFMQVVYWAMKHGVVEKLGYERLLAPASQALAGCYIYIKQNESDIFHTFAKKVEDLFVDFALKLKRMGDFEQIDVGEVVKELIKSNVQEWKRN